MDLAGRGILVLAGLKRDTGPSRPYSEVRVHNYRGVFGSLAQKSINQYFPMGLALA